MKQDQPAQNQPVQNVPGEKKDENLLPIEKSRNLLKPRNIKYIDTTVSNKEEKAKFKKPTQKRSLTEGQIFLNQLIKDNVKDKESIFNKYNKIDSIITTKEDAEFFEKLAKSIISNYKLSINDILSYKRFKMRVGSYGLFNEYKGTIFTNDKLYWLSLVSAILTGKNYEQYRPFLKLENLKIYICSRLEEIKDEYKRYYLRDYSGDFSITGFGTFDEEERKKIKEGKIEEFFDTQNKSDFEFAEVKYFVIKSKKEGNNGKIIYKENTNINDCLNKVEIFNTKKKMEKNSIDVHKIKTKSGSTNIYLSQVIDLIDFCPSELCFEDEINYEFFLDLEIEPLKLESYLNENAKKREKKPENIKDYINIKGLVDWEDLDLFINFLIVESSTVFTLEDNKNTFDELSKYLLDFFKEYKEIKSYFVYAKGDIIKILSFFKRFFESFQTRINFESLDKLNKVFRKIKSDFDLLREKEFLKEIEEFIEKYKLTELMLPIYNSVKRNGGTILTILNEMKEFFDMFEERDSEKMIKSLRSIGNNIFGILRYTFDDNSYLIDTFITPAIFLGGLLENEDFLADKIEEKIIKEEKEEEKREEAATNLLTEYEDIDREKYLKMFLGKFISMRTMNPKAIDKDGMPIKDGAIDKWFNSNIKDKDGVLNAKQKKAIINYAFQAKNQKKRFNFDTKKLKPFLDNAFNNYKIFDNAQNLKDRLILNEIDSTIQKLYEEKKKINKITAPPIIGKAEVEDMRKLGITIIDTDELPDEISNIVIELRDKGATDDVILELFKDFYGIKSIYDDIDLEKGKPDEKQKQKAIEESKKYWGQGGSKYRSYLEGVLPLNSKNKNIKVKFTAKKRKKDKDKEEENKQKLDVDANVDMKNAD